MLAHVRPRPVTPLPVTVDATTPFPASVLITLRFDGASPNPGPMGVGYTLALEKSEEQGGSRILVRVGAPVGQGTNNEAEYHALLAGMRHALKLGMWNLRVISDSLLVVNQTAGTWKTRGKLVKLRDEAWNLSRLFTSLTIEHAYREENTVADELSHQIVFEEPTLPPPPVSNTSRKTKLLQEWQAAAIRVWWLRHHPGAGTLARIFGLHTAQVEQIGHGKSYRLADFSTYPPPYLQDSTPLVAATA